MDDKPYEIIELEDGSVIVRVTMECQWFTDYSIPVGYECDGASIPWYIRWLCGNPTDEPRVIAAILHDWMYDTHVVDRSRADLIYYENLIRLGVPEWRARMEYGFIRAFGWMHW